MQHYICRHEGEKVMNWVWIVVGIAILGYVGLWFNKRTCLLAFGRGVSDAGSLPWAQIEENFSSYLRRPMSPMDAAAYRRGVEYSLTCSREADWRAMKHAFLLAYKSGAITREGTELRRMGTQAGVVTMSLRVPEELHTAIMRNHDAPPLYAKLGISRIDGEFGEPAHSNAKLLSGSKGIDIEPSCADAEKFCFDETESSSVTIGRLITEYIANHPEYEYPPSGDRHPAILAFGTNIQGWLIERMGGPTYLVALIDAAKDWFPPGCKSREFRIFCNLFEGHANVAWGHREDLQWISDRYVTWYREMRKAAATVDNSTG